MQAHHDFCAPSDLPVEVELGFHVYDDLCGEACIVGRQFVPGLATCPVAQCANSTAYTSAVNTLDTSCTATCTSPTCIAAYRTVRATHDGCDEIPEAIEVAIHNFEDICAAQECNVVTQAFDANVCSSSPVPAPSCGCLASTLGFTINCSAGSVILNAFNALANCSGTCRVAGSTCFRNYAIVQVLLYCHW